MPELPEVEVLRRSLEPRLPGARLEGVAASGLPLREPIPTAELEDDATVAVHLGMSGRLTLVARDHRPLRHEHLALAFDAGGLGGVVELRLVDPRRFGLVLVTPTAELEADRHFAHLGVEPLSADFDGDLLRRRAAGRRGPVKTFLMDATVVVGVGNIYANEALFRAGVHPRRSVARISAGRWERLAATVRAVLESAIGEGGTTLNDFVDGEGRQGYFQVSLDVYGREGEPCRVCGAAIRRIVQAGRSTFYCPRCQR